MTQTQNEIIKLIEKTLFLTHKEQMSISVKRGLALKKARLETEFVTKQPLK